MFLETLANILAYTVLHEYCTGEKRRCLGEPCWPPPSRWTSRCPAARWAARSVPCPALPHKWRRPGRTTASFRSAEARSPFSPRAGTSRGEAATNHHGWQHRSEKRLPDNARVVWGTRV